MQKSHNPRMSEQNFHKVMLAMSSQQPVVQPHGIQQLGFALYAVVSASGQSAAWQGKVCVITAVPAFGAQCAKVIGTGAQKSCWCHSMFSHILIVSDRIGLACVLLVCRSRSAIQAHCSVRR